MKKHPGKFVSMLLVFVVLLIATSCGENTKSTGDNDMIFSHMTQAEKKEYVKEYLKEAYGITAEITADISKRPINSFSSEEQYYAIAKLEDNRRIYCWITDDGRISDSSFVLNMQRDIDKIFEDIINDTISDFKISCITTLDYPTENTYDSDPTSVFTMLNTESVTTSVRIFLDKSHKDLAQDAISNCFAGKLNFTDGCVYIYYVDDLSNFDVNDFDLSKFNTSFEFKKG